MAADDSTLDPEFEIDKYQIQPEDVLDIFVWKEDDLTKKVTVGPDGAVSLPLVGTILAGGETTKDLQQDITKSLQEYISDARS